MKQEFIAYEQALILKELGFDENCVAHWYNLYNKKELYIDERFANGQNQIKNGKQILCLAPLYQQAFRWFREKYNLFHEITLDSYKEPYRLYARILKLENHRNFVINRFEIGHFDNDKFEEAELACIKKLIEIVKNK